MSVLLADGVYPRSMAWHPHPDIWAVMIMLLLGYAVALRRARPLAFEPQERSVSRKQTIFFVLGVVTMWAAADWPLHELSEDFLLSAHMVQHMVFSFVSAPLLLLGIPGWLARKLLSPLPLQHIARLITKPLPAMLVFNAFIVFSHWPVLVDLALRNPPVHLGVHVALVTVSLIMWWPVLSPVSELPRLSPPGSMLYLFLQTIVPTVPASFLTFSENPFYALYAAAPRLWGISAIDDQRMAGLLMKIGGGFILWGIITVMFFRWASREDGGVPSRSEQDGLERVPAE